MNERIEELMFEAGRYADKNTGSSDRSGMWVYQYSEKFAELIVKECAGVTLDYKNHDHYTGWCDHASEILKHFGVEE
jgi:hypothetical protein